MKTITPEKPFGRMTEILNRLFDYGQLNREEARNVLTVMAGGALNPGQMAAFLTVYRMRSITVEELAGFCDALLDLCLAVDLRDYDPIDLCGTGGDGKNTFNISTAASFVVAGAGVPVAKHGNYGVSSVSGSSNVLEYLGLRFTNDSALLRQQMELAGICYLHAPLFHPAMKAVAPVRKDLGVKTFFNMLGPLVNPAFPGKQVVGVFSMALARLYSYLLQETQKCYKVIYTLDGYDEVSLTSDVKVISCDQEQQLSPRDMGFAVHNPESLAGGNSIKSAAAIFKNILYGKGTEAQNEVVLANAGMAIHCARPQLTLDDAIGAARESLYAGKARHCFKKLLALNP